MASAPNPSASTLPVTPPPAVSMLPAAALPSADLSVNNNGGHANWADLLANLPLSLLTMNATGAVPNPGQLKHAMDWDMVGPAFHNADTVKNEHELNPSRIPDAL